MEVFYIKQELLINEQIRAREVQLISDNGEKLGTLAINKALEIAEEKKLDLVLVAPNSVPPVCKIMDYGKYKFEQSKREKEAKKKQKVQETKEIRITPNIEEHDFNFKAKNIRKFIEDGNKVKITVRFRGREVNNVKMGENVLNKFVENLQDVAVAEKATKQNAVEKEQEQMEKLDNKEITALIAKEKAEQFRNLMVQMIGQAIEENNEKLSQDISKMVNDKVLKELDYLMRVADERDEERFRQLDETIRLYQRENKGKAEAAAAKMNFLPLKFGKKRKYGKTGNKF